MKEKDITKFLDLNHQELLTELPEISQIKDYCALINDFFKNNISEDQFKSSLKKCGISDMKLLETISLINKIKSTKD